MKGKKVAVTTTNGTMAIQKSLVADEIIIGAFLNLTAVTNYLKTSDKDIIIHCAGWKGTPNLEDTAFAGAVIDSLDCVLSNDAATMALALYKSYKNNLFESLLTSAHAKRLEKFGIHEDLEFCSTIDKFDVLPKLVGKELVLPFSG